MAKKTRKKAMNKRKKVRPEAQAKAPPQKTAQRRGADRTRRRTMTTR